jgi:hypothetical protein
MTAAEIAARAKARRSGKGWIARCPAHDDHDPSLSIAAGRDRRVLLRCFAGCAVESITRALGLAVGDLFERPTAPIRRAPHRPTLGELCLALAIEERNFREGRRIEGLLRTSEVNAIRDTIAKRYGIELAPIARPLYEGGFGGRDRDEVWPAIFDWALFVASVKLLGTTTVFDETLLPPKAVLIEAEDLAARAMRDVEREGRQRPGIAA